MTHRDIAERLYPALAQGDKDELGELLDEDLVGITTAGLPLRLGGRFEGRSTMLRDFYGQIARNYRAHAEPAEFIELPDGRITVSGTYRGTGLVTGALLDAAFVHVLRFRDGRIAEIEQLTDSGRWRDALPD